MNRTVRFNHEKSARRWLFAGRLLFTAALVATTVFIFSNSMAVAEASNQASGAAQSLLYTLFDRVGMPGLKQIFTMHLVRKLAHFAEYALLGFWWMLCLRVYTRRFLRHVSWPVLACLLTALADETLQGFSAGRSAQLSDVWLDFAGSLTGLLFGLLVLGLCRMLYILVKYRDKE